MKEERKYTVEFDLADLTVDQIKTCIKMGLNPLTVNQKDSIEWFARSKNIEIIKLMGLQKMIDPDEELGRVLNRSIYDNDIEFVEYLLDCGIKPTQDDVMAALEKRHIKVAKRLMNMLEDEKD